MIRHPRRLRETPTPRLGLILRSSAHSSCSSFVYAWEKFDAIPLTLPGLILPTLIGVSSFLAATIATPANPSQWKSLDDYFDQRQRSVHLARRERSNFERSEKFG